MMGSNLTERGRATVGIVPPRIGGMKGGGMQPLIIIRPIYREMSSRHESKRGNLSFPCASVIAVHVIARVKVVVIALHTREPSLSQQHS